MAEVKIAVVFLLMGAVYLAIEKGINEVVLAILLIKVADVVLVSAVASNYRNDYRKRDKEND